MSLAVVKDPRTDLVTEEQSIHTIHTSGQRLSVDVLTADSSQRNANLISANWKIFPPSNQTIVDRYIKLRSYVEVKSTGAPWAVGTDDCPRQFPVSAISRIVSLKVNGETISRTLSDLLHAELTYSNEAEDRRKCWSMTTAYPDQYQVLADHRDDGFSRNPAGQYGENPQEPLRGSFEYEQVDANTLRFIITEPILISPLSSGVKACSGMINVNELYLDIQYDSLSERFMSCAERQNPPQITAVTAQFYQDPEVIMTYITPSQYQRLPSVQVFPYVKPREYPLSLPNVFEPLPAASATRNIRSNAIRLSQVPRSVMLFCRRQKQASTFNTADSFLGITRCSVNWNNETGLLSGATQQSLYEMSVRNGCNMSWVQWSKERGSVLMLDFGRDIQLPAGLSAGTAGSFTLQVELDVVNKSGEDFLADFYMVLYDIGSFAVSQNSARASLGNLSASMVLSAEVGGDHVAHHDHASAMKGGALLESLGTMLPAHHVRRHGKRKEEEKAAPMMEEGGGRRVGGSLLRRR